MRRRIVFAIPLVLLNGCGSFRVPLRQEKANAHAFSSGSEILQVFKSLEHDIKHGKTISRHDSLDRLRVNTVGSNVEDVRADEIPRLLFGGSYTTSDHKFLLEIRKRFTAVKVPFRNMRDAGVLAFPFHVQTHRDGYDLWVVLIFDRGNLTNTDHFGTAHINTTTKAILFNPFSAFSEGVSRATSSGGGS